MAHRGHHDDERVGERFLSVGMHELPVVHHWHVKIQKNDTRLGGVDQVEPMSAVVRGGDQMPTGRQDIVK